MNKCKHGVYDPHGDGAYCQFCNPATNEVSEIPKETPMFNRRGSLNMTETGRLPKCPYCAAQGITSILAVSNGGICAVCHNEFTILAPHNLRANNKQPGLCPQCGSGVHFEKDRKTWKCADCDAEYKAPKRTA